MTTQHIALLPGLDGSGELFFPIIPYLKQCFEVQVVKYADQSTLAELVECVESQLPKNTSVSLVAESFSGPVAIALLAAGKSRFNASVLSASFCRSPLPFLTQLAGFVPESLFGRNALSHLLLDFLCTDNSTGSDVRDKALQVLEKVEPRYFKQRLQLLHELNLAGALEQIEVPLLYIEASNDRIVYPGSRKELMKHARNLEIAKVEGPHMILQSRPQKCAELIIRHVTSNRP